MKTFFWILAMTLSVAGCQNKEQEAPAATHQTENNPDFPIGEASHIYLKNTRQVNASVGIAPAGLVQVNTPFPVFVSGVKVAEGQSVQKGQILASISHPDLIDLQEAWILADLDLERSKEKFTRLQGLSTEAAVSTQELKAAESEWKQAEAGEQALRSKLQMLGLSVASLRRSGIAQKISIQSPVDGLVAVVSASEGELIEAGSSLFEILDTDHIRIELNLPPDLSIALEEHPLLVWNNGEAEVYALDPGLFSMDRTRRAYARSEAGMKHLRVGEFFTAELVIEADSVWAVPVQSVVFSGDSASIFRLKGGMPQALNFRPGLRNKDWVAIPDEFARLDSLILGKAHRLGLGAEE